MKIFENYSLKDFNTFRIDVKAKKILNLQEENDLLELKSFINDSSLQTYFLGNGSNVLLTRDLEGIVVHNEMSDIRKIDESDDFVVIEADSGADWHSFVKWCTARGYFGLENLALIPGSVGAAPVQNVGAYGVEQSDYFLSADVFDINSGHFFIWDNNKCGFGYRFSNFKLSENKQLYVCKVRYKLSKKFTPNINYLDIKKYFEESYSEIPEDLTAIEVFDAICQIRRRKLPDPYAIPNAGSFFKNPVITLEQSENLLKLLPDVKLHQVSEINFKVSAAFLIEKAGWKGRKIGNAGVSESHSLILVNYGNAQGFEISDLSKSIIDDIFEKYGILLEPEVILW